MKFKTTIDWFHWLVWEIYSYLQNVYNNDVAAAIAVDRHIWFHYKASGSPRPKKPCM